MPIVTTTGLRLVVRHRFEAAEGVAVLELAAADGESLPPWEPGAHIDLVLPDDVERQYSLCGDPRDRARWRIAVLRESNGRGGSAYVHDKLTEGAVVQARGPRNHFAFEPAARYLFVAGGIGVTPLLPMASAASAAGADWRLVYGGRSRTSMAFLGELRARYGERVVVRPEDEYGLLDLDALLGSPEPGTHVYCCGPGPLLDAVEERCAHWPAGSLHVERFSPKEVGEPVRHDSFEIELAVTGGTLTVPPGVTVLDVLRDNGVWVDASCEEGTCGTCETAVLSGTVDHRDSVLSAEERAEHTAMMVCVSRAACPRLVLDL
jgi:ferredoxin-NADP reductase